MLSRFKGKTNISNAEVDRVKNEFMLFKKKYPDFAEAFEIIIKSNDTRNGRREIGKGLRNYDYNSNKELRRLNRNFSEEAKVLSGIICDAMQRESWGYKHLFYIFEMTILFNENVKISIEVNENVSKDILSKLFQ